MGLDALNTYGVRPFLPFSGRWYYGDAKRMGEVEAIVIENNVTEYILSKAKITDKAIAFDDLMGQG